MKPEDIKVGSVWEWTLDPNIKIEVVGIININTLESKFIKHTVKQLIGAGRVWDVELFRLYYNPVYTVEGFEV